jgi:hypothetical protein
LDIALMESDLKRRKLRMAGLKKNRDCVKGSIDEGAYRRTQENDEALLFQKTRTTSNKYKWTLRGIHHLNKSGIQSSSR